MVVSRRVNSTVRALRSLIKTTEREACRQGARRSWRFRCLVETSGVRRRPRLLVPVNEKPVARYNEERSNNSLDASGVSGLLIHNLSVAQSSAAASTQPLGVVHKANRLRAFARRSLFRGPRNSSYKSEGYQWVSNMFAA